jgi:hypothetical protein
VFVIYPSEDDFYRGVPARQGSSECDFGFHRTPSGTFRLTWIESTLEVCAVWLTGPDASPAAVEVLGRGDRGLIEAAIRWGINERIAGVLVRDEVRRAVSESPHAQASRIRDHQVRVCREEDERRQTMRREFEVVAVTALPVPDVDLPLTGPCGCSYCDGDWKAVANTAVSVLREGVDPLDSDAVWGVIDLRLSSKPDRRWTASLFDDPIVVKVDQRRYVNGRHRAHALIRAGVGECVVCRAAG